MIKKIPPAAIALAASLTLAAGHARAQSSTKVSVNPGSEQDLFLGFQASGDNDLIVDIGSDTQFLTATTPFTIQFGVIPTGQTGAGTAVYSLASDLSANYTSSWATNTALNWGVAGDDENNATELLFLSQDATNPRVPNNPSGQAYDNYTADIDSLSFQLSKDYSTVNSTEAASVTSASADSWSSYTPYTNAFGTGLDIEQAPGDGVISTLSLYEETRGGSGSATDLGTLSLASNGDVTFTPASVPEPSSWLSILGGALFLGLFRLRRNVRPS